MIDYDPHNWHEHLLDVRGSLVREIIGRVATCGLWAVAVYLFDWWLHYHDFSLHIPETTHAMMGGVLGLLLVFRTNSSYDRFWEGRKLWGSIVNQTRNLARTSKEWLSADEKLAEQVREWIVAFPWATMHRLRRTKTLLPPLKGISSSQITAAEQAEHPVLAVAGRLTALFYSAFERGLIRDIQLKALEEGVERLIDHLGACERINNTPMPFAYMVHLRRALIMYCFSLPFALLDRYDWGVIPITFLVAYILFGIEEIGVEIESPFGNDENDLPLERLCEMITENVRAL